jgi:hypothetical protein
MGRRMLVRGLAAAGPLLAVAVVAPLLTVSASSVAPEEAGATSAPGPDAVVAVATPAGEPGGADALGGPLVGIAATAGGEGYWTVTSAGAVTGQGQVGNYGSLTGVTLNAPVVGMAAVPGGGGYWLVAADGGVFSYGSAQFYGSTGAMRLNAPVVGMAAVPGGGGYWLVAADGGVFAFGAAPFSGAGIGGPLDAPVIGMAAATTGYWIAYGQTADPTTPLGQEELLAGLGYLPLTWSPQGFQWAWPDNPPQLTALWVPGQYNSILEGAIDAFDAVVGLPMTGQVTAAETAALLGAAFDPTANMNPNGYSYALAQENVGTGAPETLTVWHDGAVVDSTPANTGIAVSPTLIGTFPVYIRLRNQVMTGINPDGTPYADPVQFVAYFTGGDAIHYMPRTTYGYPQSLGCVEIPYGPASVIWNYTTYGTLVTVTPT